VGWAIGMGLLQVVDQKRLEAKLPRVEQENKWREETLRRKYGDQRWENYYNLSKMKRKISDHKHQLNN